MALVSNKHIADRPGIQVEIPKLKQFADTFSVHQEGPV
jgi:hypothetical protein